MNRLCQLLDIKYPIICGAMNWVSNAEMAAAVSNAGGLGTVVPSAGLPASGGDPVENLRKHIRKARELTDRPIGVNIPLDRRQAKEYCEVAIAEGANVAISSAGNPATYTGMLKAGGLKVLHVVASVKHARHAEAVGVDAVVAEGYEAGGHNGLDELPTFVLVPQVADAVKAPVVAAGGIADARGLLAALLLGADGVQMGTRFLATTECMAHPNLKQAIVNAPDTGTVIVMRKLGVTRSIKTGATQRYLEAEARGASVEELKQLRYGRGRLGLLEGDLEEGDASCGASAGLVKDIVSAGEVVRRMMADVPLVLDSLKTRLNLPNPL
ncbi:MAG: nitronate monooxygenase [Chloroflexi bacterium]|nr:nitronate monooxygenase [Chloroflexota bacterium]